MPSLGVHRARVKETSERAKEVKRMFNPEKQPGFGSGVIAPWAGFPRYGYTREIPYEMRVIKDCSNRLPYDLHDRGYELLQVIEEQTTRGDPFVLYDPYGDIVAQWEAMPSYGELLHICEHRNEYLTTKG